MMPGGVLAIKTHIYLLDQHGTDSVSVLWQLSCQTALQQLFLTCMQVYTYIHVFLLHYLKIIGNLMFT